MNASALPPSIRLFVALLLPLPVQRALESLQQQLQALDTGGCVRWTSGEAVHHLTLKFLGEVPSAQLERAAAALQEAALYGEVFSLALDGAGAFPNLRLPRVLWAGITGDLLALRALHQAVETRLAALGHPVEERAFSPHITLGRARQNIPHDELLSFGLRLRQALEAGQLQPASGAAQWPVQGMSLMRSTLNRAGAVYDELVLVPFGSAAAGADRSG
jgi:2'-5' RNA ligase